MSQRGGRKLFNALWVVVGTTLASVGCTAQVTFMGPLPNNNVPEGVPSPAPAATQRYTLPSSSGVTPTGAPSEGGGIIQTGGKHVEPVAGPELNMPMASPMPMPSKGSSSSTIGIMQAGGQQIELVAGPELPAPMLPKPSKVSDSSSNVLPAGGKQWELVAGPDLPAPLPMPSKGAGPGASGFAAGAPAPAGVTSGPDCHGGEGGYGSVPHELNKVSYPPYMIEAPDILFIDTVRLIPKPPYKIEPFDILLLQVAEAFPNQPITGPYAVSPDGSIILGFSYGSVRVAGLSLEQAEAAIRSHLSKVLKNPQVALALGQFRGVQQTRGEHIVRPDGTISLGTYGAVYVQGLTLGQAKCVIERHLSQYVQDPEIALDVFAYNSKFYYIVLDGGGYGQQVFRFPATGNETVLDAVSLINGLPQVASRRRIWVARPAPAEAGCDQVLPVDWMAIVQGGSTATNYQLFPGDRIYVKADCLVALDNWLAKIFSPIERVFGVTLLGTATVQSFGNNGLFNNGLNGRGF
jgi:polysaccharide export outer membrane protein